MHSEHLGSAIRYISHQLSVDTRRFDLYEWLQVCTRLHLSTSHSKKSHYDEDYPLVRRRSIGAGLKVWLIELEAKFTYHPYLCVIPILKVTVCSWMNVHVFLLSARTYERFSLGCCQRDRHIVIITRVYG